jgi:hypothetical protein
MKWWQIKKRDADLERELRSDLELEEEEQREAGASGEEARYAALRASAIRPLFVNRLAPSGPGTGLNPSRVICALACARLAVLPVLPSSPSW